MHCKMAGFGLSGLGASVVYCGLAAWSYKNEYWTLLAVVTALSAHGAYSRLTSWVVSPLLSAHFSTSRYAIDITDMIRRHMLGRADPPEVWVAQELEIEFMVAQEEDAVLEIEFIHRASQRQYRALFPFPHKEGLRIDFNPPENSAPFVRGIVSAYIERHDKPILDMTQALSRCWAPARDTENEKDRAHAWEEGWETEEDPQDSEEEVEDTGDETEGGAETEEKTESKPARGIRVWMTIPVMDRTCITSADRLVVLRSTPPYKETFGINDEITL